MAARRSAGRGRRRLSGRYARRQRSTRRLRRGRRYGAGFDTGLGARAWPVEAAAVLAALENLSGRHVLEGVWGTRRLAGLLTAQGATGVGVDIDAAMFAIAAGRVPRRLVHADASRLPLADDVVDAAVTLATL